MSQEETDYAWLDEVVAELPIVHKFGCGALEYSDGGLMDYTCHCGNSRKAKTAIHVHLTAQAKQHQVELVWARIETARKFHKFTTSRYYGNWSAADQGLMESHRVFAVEQIQELQAELDKLKSEQ